MERETDGHARWTLIGAAVGSVLLLMSAVLWLRPDPEPQALDLPAPWQPPPEMVVAEPSRSVVPSAEPSLPLPLPPSPTRTKSPEPQAQRPTTRPPATRRPTTTPTTRPPERPNLSLRADGDADGSTKAQGRRFNDVRDGDLGTFWSPVGSTGEISAKWPVPVTLSRVRIREVSGGGRIRAWQLRNHAGNAVLASGGGVGEIRFGRVTLRKVTLVIFRSDGTPRVAEFETFES